MTTELNYTTVNESLCIIGTQYIIRQDLNSFVHTNKNVQSKQHATTSTIDG